MTRLSVAMLLGILAAPLSAHEISRPESRNVDGLSQMARLHAQKACVRRAERNRAACEAEQIRSLAETAASVAALRPANVMPGEFAAMIENHASAGFHGGWRTSFGRDDSPVDCRVNVC